MTRPGSLEAVPLPAGSELPEWATGLVGEHLLVGTVPVEVEVEVPVAAAATAEAAPDESWTIEALREYAKANDVNLKGATSKADILDAVKG